MTPWATLLCTASLAAASCSDTSSLPPHGEVVIVVDTDMPVPRIVDHLRIDVYSADSKTWVSSRDVLRPTPNAWPTSFSVYTNDDNATRDAIVRLRAYGGANVADYRGEQFTERAAPLTGPERLVPINRPTPAARSDCARYLCLKDSQHADVTPPTVPIAALAIDRLVSVHVYPGVVRTAAITLKGNCVGTPADLAGLRTCVDTEATLSPLTREPLIDGVPSQKASVQGSFETPYQQLPCNGAPHAETGLHDSEVCIPGGVFVFGARYEVVQRDSDAYPERMVLLPSFFVDKYEFSVGRLRDALASGYSATTQFIVNNGPANDPKLADMPNSCTMSDNPIGREDAPLNCVTATTARDLCRFEGGDLPTEAQWEYVATVIGRDRKTLTPPYGPDGLPSCKGVALGRSRDLTTGNGRCQGVSGYGTAPVTFGEGVPLGDESFGVVGLSGGVSERTQDAFASLASNCWFSQPMLSPTCVSEGNSERTTARGSHWKQPLDYSTYMIREGLSQTGGSTTLGFRCTRSAL